LDWGLFYISLGTPIFPLNGKRPFETGGFKTASIDENQVREWAEKYPGCNWGEPTGMASGVDVLDIDGPKGLESLRMYEMQFGPMPKTPHQRTGSGGLHYLFKSTGTVRNSAKGMMPGWDTRGEGGYFVLGGSIHPDTGKPYEWEIPPDAQEAADWPEPALDLYFKQTKEKRKPPEPGEKVRIGQQDNEMTRRAGILLAQRFSPDAILAALEKENQERFEPPLADADLRRIVDSVCTYVPNPALLNYPRSDAGNGERVASKATDRVFWCKERKSWYAFDRQRWQPDGDIPVTQLAIEVAREGLRCAKDLPEPDKENDKENWDIWQSRINFFLGSESKRALDAAVALSRGFGLSVSQDRLDADPFKLNCQNGTYDFRAQKLLPHDPADLISKVAGTAFDPEARCPMFISFITGAMAGDQSVVDYHQKLSGIFLTGDVTPKILPIFYGPPNTGKTTYTEILLALLGDYGQVMSEAVLGASTKPSDPGAASPHLARLPGIRLALVSETGKRYRLNQAAAKNMTGRNRMTARPIYGVPFDFDPTHKTLVETNDRPLLEGDDDATFDRVHLVPFNRVIAPEHQDKAFPEKLKAELPGILNWAIEGYIRWQREGLNVPEAIRAATHEYRSDMNPLVEFLDERCQIETEGSNYVPARVLYTAYKTWWLEQRRGNPLKEREFSRSLIGLIEREGHSILKEQISSGDHKGSVGWMNLRVLVDHQTKYQKMTATEDEWWTP
jgi:putative DNA primase/helicase